jgi:hypothetical protein
MADLFVSIVRAAVLHQIEDQLVGDCAHFIPPNLPQIERELTTMSWAKLGKLLCGELRINSVSCSRQCNCRFRKSYRSG